MTKDETREPATTAFFALAILSGVLALALAWLVHAGTLTAIDGAVGPRFLGHVPLAQAVTLASEGAFALAGLAGLALLHPRFKNQKWGATTLAALVLALGAAEVVKLLVARARPTYLLVPDDGYSFPSAHTTLADALAVVFCAWVFERYARASTRTLAVGVAAAFVIFVAWARLALGVHYASDVVGGTLLGAGAGFTVQAVAAMEWGSIATWRGVRDAARTIREKGR